MTTAQKQWLHIIIRLCDIYNEMHLEKQWKIRKSIELVISCSRLTATLIHSHKLLQTLINSQQLLLKKLSLTLMQQVSSNLISSRSSTLHYTTLFSSLPNGAFRQVASLQYLSILNRSARRKPTTFGRALTYSFHMSVMSEVLSEDRTQDSEVKGACSDDCATKAPPLVNSCLPDITKMQTKSKARNAFMTALSKNETNENKVWWKH